MDGHFEMAYNGNLHQGSQVYPCEVCTLEVSEANGGEGDFLVYGVNCEL